jgi:hypothetical protein
VQFESSVEKLVPEICTAPPGAAVCGSSVIVGVPGPTWNTAFAESSLGLAVAVTLYEPAGTSATTNCAVKVPSVIVQVGELTGCPDKEQLVSFVEKSDPETLIVAPNEPELESKEMDGLAVVVSVELVRLVVTLDELVDEVDCDVVV